MIEQLGNEREQSLCVLPWTTGRNAIAQVVYADRLSEGVCRRRCVLFCHHQHHHDLCHHCHDQQHHPLASFPYVCAPNPPPPAPAPTARAKHRPQKEMGAFCPGRPARTLDTPLAGSSLPCGAGADRASTSQCACSGLFFSQRQRIRILKRTGRATAINRRAFRHRNGGHPCPRVPSYRCGCSRDSSAPPSWRS